MPPQVIFGLFTATIVGATSRFVNLAPAAWIAWFAYWYLAAYRTKQVLDDLVYYELMKGQAVRRGDPLVAFLSWVLWLIAAINIGTPWAFFGLMSLISAVGVVWVWIAEENVFRPPEDIHIEDVPNLLSADIEAINFAHKLWWWANWVPLGVGLCYWIVYVAGVSKLDAAAFESSWLLWLGPAIMFLALGIDIWADRQFMFKLWSRTSPSQPVA